VGGVAHIKRKAPWRRGACRCGALDCKALVEKWGEP